MFKTTSKVWPNKKYWVFTQNICNHIVMSNPLKNTSAFQAICYEKWMVKYIFYNHENNTIELILLWQHQIKTIGKWIKMKEVYTWILAFHLVVLPPLTMSGSLVGFLHLNHFLYGHFLHCGSFFWNRALVFI